MCVTAYRAENREGSAGPSAAYACHADLCIQTSAAQDAIRLTQLGARAGLVVPAHRPGEDGRQPPLSPAARETLTARAAALHRQLVSQAGPADGCRPLWSGTCPSASPVPDASPAQRLIDVYESYRWLEPEPLLDITRVAFVPHLVAVQDWQAQTCSQCGIQYLLPRGSVGNTCWGCRLLSAAPVPVLRYTPHRPYHRQTPGGLQRLPTGASPSGIRDMALKRTVLHGRPRDPGCRCRAGASADSPETLAGAARGEPGTHHEGEWVHP